LAFYFAADNVDIWCVIQGFLSIDAVHKTRMNPDDLTILVIHPGFGSKMDALGVWKLDALTVHRCAGEVGARVRVFSPGMCSLIISAKRVLGAFAKVGWRFVYRPW
jgi:hypothetical protein